MHADTFIHDMAIIMLVAGLITIIFNKLKQPVVLGYLLAGVIIGPHTPPFELIHDKQIILVLGELGVIFLMFSLGLEFSLKKLAKVGPKAFITAVCETSLMVAIGYNLGHWFGWQQMDCIFLGAMMAISSTTIIVKALGELGMKQQKFAQLIFGVLIVEDILAIAIIALLSGLATSGAVDSHEILSTVGKLSLFIIVSLILGLLTIPRLLAYIAKFNSHEMMLISVLGLCFGFCLLVLALNYSVALGAFMMGAIVAEARPLALIEKLIEPVRDMFCAIFFVTIGMMLNPGVMLEYLTPILLISLALMGGKIIGATTGSFISGQNGKTSLRIGMGLAQIGEFSFIIASLGSTLKVTSSFLYPIAITVSAITTLLTPYLIQAADPISRIVSNRIPKLLKNPLKFYTIWLRDLHPTGDSAMLVKIIGKIVLQVIVNCALVIAVFLAGIFIATNFDQKVINDAEGTLLNEQIHRAIICGLAIFISLPFLIAAYRKLKALAMILSEMWISSEFGGKNTYKLRRIIFESLPIIAIVLIMCFIFSISKHILPDPEILVMIITGEILLAIALWKPMVRLQSWLQIELFTVMESNNEHN
jgi:CPA2 family monovalent cation:H+ antiporter-2